MSENFQKIVLEKLDTIIALLRVQNSKDTAKIISTKNSMGTFSSKGSVTIDDDSASSLCESSCNYFDDNGIHVDTTTVIRDISGNVVQFSTCDVASEVQMRKSLYKDL